MARKATGAVVSHVGRDGLTYRALRFSAYGKRRFASLGAVSEEDASRKLARVLDEVAEGTWQEPKAIDPPAEPDAVLTFHEFAAQWWLRNEGRWASKTKVDYRWRLENHLLPFFREMRLDQITYDTVERYIAAKLAEDDPLSARCINMTLITLAAILETAVEREVIARNPAKGKLRRLRERAPQRGYLDSARQISALLDVAAQMDREASKGRRHVQRRALLAVLVFAGLRIGELCELRWRDVDLAGGWLHTGSKTDAGYRRIKIRGALRDALLSIKAPDGHPDAYVFPTARRGKTNPSNVRNRILGPAVEKASERLVKEEGAPLPHLTPHGCRRTFASVLYALGETPPVVMAEMGHATPELALAIYAHAMRREPEETEALRALVEGRQLAVIGSRADLAVGAASERRAA
ncbi:MAG: tyrosine-type recombinase/integrase [Solirubrobacteraceae bacterium]